MHVLKAGLKGHEGAERQNISKEAKKTQGKIFGKTDNCWAARVTVFNGVYGVRS